MMIPFHPTVVVIFVRCPIPGRVKTRLAQDLGAKAACDLYRAMVTDSIANVRASGLPMFLFHDGQDITRLSPEWIRNADSVFNQEGESLGERMGLAFERAFSTGAEGVILTGSDCPGIDVELIQSAQHSIGKYDAVFSPAFDGGFCLIASKRGRFNCNIFQGIPWSTSYVLDMTVAACTTHGLSCHLLKPHQDIDTVNDLTSYCLNPSKSAPITNAWLVSHGLMVNL